MSTIFNILVFRVGISVGSFKAVLSPSEWEDKEVERSASCSYFQNFNSQQKCEVLRRTTSSGPRGKGFRFFSCYITHLSRLISQLTSEIKREKHNHTLLLYFHMESKSLLPLSSTFLGDNFSSDWPLSVFPPVV